MDGNYEDEDSSQALGALKAKVPFRPRYYLRP